MRFTDQAYNFDSTEEEDIASNQRWMAQALVAATGIAEDEAMAYTFAASRIGGEPDIIGVLDRFDHFGTERLQDLAAFTGINAFEDYNLDQLKLMEDLLRRPGETAKYLADHDVTVVMVNRVGDGSSALTNTAEIFDDGKGRTLFFEINSMSDIYRHMLKLRDLEVKPSTLVLAAHSAPGQFIVSDIREPSEPRRNIATVLGRNLVQSVNDGDELEEGDFGYSMHGMKGFARIIEDFMQPSRAIDDAEEDEGRKKILFQACEAATEVNSRDIDDEGNTIVLGMASVASQLGADLLESGIQSSVDIYGAPTSIQLHKSEQGVRYSSNPTTLEGERQPQHAVRIRVEHGQLDKHEVDEVAMHR